MRWLGRKSWILVSLLALSTLMAVAQNRAYQTGRPSVVQEPGLAALRPLEHAVTSLRAFGDDMKAGFGDNETLDAQNRQLHSQVALLSLRSDHLMHVADENTRLREMLAMKQHDPSASRWVAADVVERRPSHWFEFITLNRGAEAGIRDHSVVLTPQGLVGQVVMVRPDTCDVQLLTDASSNAGAFIARTHDVGYVQGIGREDLVLNFFDKDHAVKIGDSVVSSPFSALYPSGILIGSVTSISTDSRTSATTAMVRPAVPFNGLEEAFVIP